MKTVLRLSIILVTVLTSLPHNLAVCGERPEFNNYEEAIIWVRSNDSLVKDSVDTSKSSWIKAAEFYYDNTGYGFLILNMKGKEYIWEGVPLDIWYSFKNADSFGVFYHSSIKGKYHMDIKN